MPEGLTQTKTPTFSETQPEIDRNGGRLQIGTVAGFTSEYPAGINRNQRASMLSGRPPALAWLRILSALLISANSASKRTTR